MRSLIAVVALLLAGAWSSSLTDLDALADRLGGRERFDAISSLRLVSDVEADGPDGMVSVRSTVSIRLPEAARFRQELPSGTVTTVWAGGAVRTRTRDTTRVLRPEVARRLQGQLFLTLPYLLARREALTLDRLSWEGDDTILSLRATDLDAPLRLVVGPDGLPGSLATTVAGAEIRVTYGRYRRTGGLMLPFESVQTVDGDTTGVTTLVSVEIDPDLPGQLFSLD